MGQEQQREEMKAGMQRSGGQQSGRRNMQQVLGNSSLLSQMQEDADKIAEMQKDADRIAKMQEDTDRIAKMQEDAEKIAPPQENPATIPQSQNPDEVIQGKFEASVSLLRVETVHEEIPVEAMMVDTVKLEGRSKTGLKSSDKDAQGAHTIADTFVKKYQKEAIKGRPLIEAIQLYEALFQEMDQDLSHVYPDELSTSRQAEARKGLEAARQNISMIKEIGGFTQTEWRKLMTELIIQYNDAYAYNPAATRGYAGSNSGKGEGSGKQISKRDKRAGEFNLGGASYLIDVDSVERTGIKPEAYATYGGRSAEESMEISKVMLDPDKMDDPGRANYKNYPKMLLWLILTQNEAAKAERADKMNQNILSGTEIGLNQAGLPFTGLEFETGIQEKIELLRNHHLQSLGEGAGEDVIKKVISDYLDFEKRLMADMISQDGEIMEKYKDQLLILDIDKLDPLTRRTLTMYGYINYAYKTREHPQRPDLQVFLRRHRLRDAVTAFKQDYEDLETQAGLLFWQSGEENPYWSQFTATASKLTDSLSEMMINLDRDPGEITKNFIDFSMAMAILEVEEMPDTEKGGALHGLWECGNILITLAEQMLESIN